jgi:hypothetical protein
VLEEILCWKLVGAELAAAAPDASRAMGELARAFPVAALVRCLEGAVRARGAVDAMANPRLQAEQWWMSASGSLRGE